MILAASSFIEIPFNRSAKCASARSHLYSKDAFRYPNIPAVSIPTEISTRSFDITDSLPIFYDYLFSALVPLLLDGHVELSSRSPPEFASRTQLFVSRDLLACPPPPFVSHMVYVAVRNIRSTRGNLTDASGGGPILAETKRER